MRAPGLLGSIQENNLSTTHEHSLATILLLRCAADNEAQLEGRKSLGREIFFGIILGVSGSPGNHKLARVLWETQGFLVHVPFL